MTRGFLFDVNQCTGCHACELACSTENQLDWGHSWRQVVTFNEDRRPAIPTYHLSLACNHCLDAPCQKNCPALAIDRDDSTGAVLIDDNKCMGCKYCSWACPYDAPQFDTDAGVMTKCTWCNHRLAEGLEPACVERCPTTALGFGPLEGAEVVPGFPSTAAQPAIRFAPRQSDRPPVETTWEIPQDVVDAFVAAKPVPPSPISLRGEWPLLLFTSLVTALAGWMAASLGGVRPPGLLLFVTLFIVAAGASTMHLGNKSRMWRAILNLRGSWLSREIVSFGAFAGVSCIHLAWPDVRGLGFAAVGLGAMTLFSIDRVYDLVRTGRRLHSADTLLTGSLLTALLLDATAVALALAMLKLVFYVSRGAPRATWIRWGVRPVRLLALASALELGLWGSSTTWALFVFAIGELLDRGQFYDELDVTSPRRQVAIDLAIT